jgi:hypothetical protein
MTGVGLADGSLLFAGETGGLWRVSPSGVLRPVRADPGEIPLRPHAVYRGAGGQVYALDGTAEEKSLEVVVSSDEGRSWRRVRLGDF